MPEVTLRPATMADVPLLAAWDRQPHVIAATGADDVSDWTHELAVDARWTEHLIAEEDGRPVGIVQLIDPENEETHYWGDCGPNLRALDIWLGEARDLGRGLGSRMMRLAVERCFAAPEVKAILIDPLESNTRARGFYERLGFQEVGKRRFGADDCVVYRLDRAAWEQK